MASFDNIILLAGGSSSRFWPLGDKNLLTFCGLELIGHQILLLSTYSTHLFIVTNETNHAPISRIVTKLGNNAAVVVQKGSGQNKAILSVKDLIKGSMLVVNSNDIFESGLIDDMVTKIATANCECLLTAKQARHYFPGGYIRHSGEQVTEVVEKPNKDDLPSNYVKLVLDYYRDGADFIKTLSANTHEEDDGYEKSISNYIKMDKKVLFIPYKGAWSTLKYPWHTLSVSNQFLKAIKQNTGKNVSIHNSAVIEGDVYIDDDVSIGEFTKIIGPAYIGKKTIIGMFSMIRQSMIGENCLIGSSCEVTRSYLGNTVFLHRNYIGDSVIENNVLVGGEAITANFRFDEQEISSLIKGKVINTGCRKLGAIIGSNVKIGVNTSLMPGIKIGAGTHIAPQSLIKRDVA